MPFKQQLQQKLRKNLSKTELENLPSGYQQLGKIILIKIDKSLEKKSKEIAQAMLQILPYASTVMQISEIKGKFRKPEVKFLAGKKKFIAENSEAGCRFEFDARKIMWSKGNRSERERIAMLPKTGEIVMDFFAGIGYWTVPILKAGNASKVIAFEHNPEAVKWLKRNLQLNKIPAEKFEIIMGKTEKNALKFPESFADRILLGLIPAPKFALPAALHCIKDNGIIHYEGTAVEGKPEELFKDVEQACEKAKCKAALINAQKVKDYAPRISHYTLDIQILKK